MRCKLCNAIIKKGTKKKHCPACARAARLIKKIPKGQRQTLRRIIADKRIAIRRLLS